MTTYAKITDIRKKVIPGRIVTIMREDTGRVDGIVTEKLFTGRVNKHSDFNGLFNNEMWCFGADQIVGIHNMFEIGNAQKERVL